MAALVKKYFLLFVAAGSLMTMGLASAPTPAQASGPIVWNHTGGSVPMYWGTRTSAGIKAWLPNSSRVGMYCWADDQWYYGNYWSNRWFYVQNYPTGQWGYVPASYVYYQVGVPHC